MGRSPCCDKDGLKKGPWTPEEDQKLIDYIQKHGYGNWRTLPKNAGLQRCGKSCRLRWTNYLRPDIKRGKFSFEEEETIIQLHSILGNKWSAIAARLPGRTDNEIKNYWNTHIRKRLLRMGIDPVTHSPRLDLLDLSSILGNSPFYNTNNYTSSPLYSHLNMSRLLGLQPLLNPDILKLASSLLSNNQPQNPNATTLIQDFHVNEFPNNNLMNPMLQTTQIQNDIPIFTTMTSTPIVTTATTTTTDIDITAHARLYNEAQLMDPNFEQYPKTIPILTTSANQYGPIEVGSGSGNSDQWGSNGSAMPEGLVSYDSCMDHSSISAVHQSFLSYIPSSLMSTPSSSSPTPLNSSSNSTTYVNSCATEDERESHCSDIIKFQVPDLLDVNHFLLAQTN